PAADLLHAPAGDAPLAAAAPLPDPGSAAPARPLRLPPDVALLPAARSDPPPDSSPRFAARCNEPPSHQLPGGSAGAAHRGRPAAGRGSRAASAGPAPGAFPAASTG